MKKANEMTEKELRGAARTYDNINNEGGEGHNPYLSEMKRREDEELRATPKTKQDQIDALYHRIELECGSTAREWGNTDKIDSLRTSLYSKIKHLEAVIEAEFLAAWPLEITKIRRVEWNDFINSLSIGGGRVSPDDSRTIHKKQHDQGWMMHDLKRAVLLHQL